MALTATEEQVLGILCQGYSAPQAARQLKVAVSTVRSHVRSLCAKTRSNGVRELVSRVAVLPPVAPRILARSGALSGPRAHRRRARVRGDGDAA